MMPPAGRPRKAENRDLAPGVYRRKRSGGKARLYDANGRALGVDPRRAAYEIAARAHSKLAPQLPTWLGATASYREWLAKPGPPKRPAAATQATYRKHLRVLDDTLGAIPLDAIRATHIYQILHTTEDRPYWSAALLKQFRIVWQRAILAGLTERVDPSDGIRAPDTPPRTVRVTNEMLLRVTSRGDQMLKDWGALAVVCGQRVSDVLRLGPEHVIDGELIPPNTKTGEPVRIAFTGGLKALVAEFLARPDHDPNGPFVQFKGRACTYSMLFKRFDAAMAAVIADDPDFPRFQRRDLRSKSARDEPATAQARLGHTSARMTQKHYIREAPLAQPAPMPPGILDQNPNAEPLRHAARKTRVSKIPRGKK